MRGLGEDTYLDFVGAAIPGCSVLLSASVVAGVCVSLWVPVSLQMLNAGVVAMPLQMVVAGEWHQVA